MTSAADTFQERYQAFSQLAESWLQSVVPDGLDPSKVLEASRYTLLLPGKRFRPVLTLAAAELLGISFERVRSLALAVECIHAASLIHDDLPALDNDNTRRGKPTCHLQFGEAVAVLAGDYLIAKSIDLVASDQALSGEERAALSALLAQTICGLCVGQGIEFSLAGSAAARDHLESSQQLKTGVLIATAVAAPAKLLNPTDQNFASTYDTLYRYGLLLGEIFQIVDDLLDNSLSKNRSETRAKFPSFTDLHGVTAAQAAANVRKEKAKTELSRLPFDSTFLSELIDLARNRSA